MYQLYGSKLTGSAAVEAGLREVDAVFEIIPVDLGAGEQHGGAFEQINPRRQVPVLRLPDGSIMTESAAMLLHIADAFDSPRLAPAPGSPARAQHDRWLLFMSVNVYGGMSRQFRPENYTQEPACAPSVKHAAIADAKHHYQLLEDAVKEGPYFFGDPFTVLDIDIWMLVYCMDPPWLERECPKVKRLADAVAARSKIAPVHAYHFG